MTYTFYLASLIVSVVVPLGLAFYLWRRRHTPGAIAATVLMLAITVWALGHVLEFKSTELSAKLAANNVVYLGIVVVPVAWLTFSLQYTGYDRWLTRRNLSLLAIIPLVTIVLVFTNKFHGLMWYDAQLVIRDSLILQTKTNGLWFWVHLSYSCLLVFLGIGFLLRRLFRPPLYRRQSLALLIGAFLPGIWNTLYLLGLTPFYPLDMTPSAFTISGLIMAWGLFRFRMFDIVPLARDAVLEGLHDGIIVLDTQNRLIDLNRVAQRVIGYSASELIGRPITDVLYGQPELLEHLRDATTTQVELTFGKGDTQYHYEVSITPLQNRHGHLIGRLIMLHDITQRKLIEARNRELEEEAHLASRLASIGEMTSSLAHEVNNPLSSVIGYAELLLERDIPEESRRGLEAINRGATRVASIMERLLLFAGRYTPNWSYVDINQTIEITLELRAPSLTNRNIEVIKQLDPALPRTLADADRLQQVFLNLVMNAEASVSEAHDGGKLIIKTRRVDNNLEISFQDDGLGIARENLGKLFQPFFTTKGPGRGTGLGLSICHGIVREHKGRIYAESEFGKGSTFFVELPIIIEDEPTKPAEPPTREPDTL